MKFSSAFLAKNLKNWRESLGYSQIEFAAIFEGLKNRRHARAVISSYETMEAVPKLDYIFEVAEKLGASLDDLFSVELVIKEGKIINKEVQSDIGQLHGIKLENWDDVMMALMELSKVAALVPGLLAKVERLENELKSRE